MAGQGEWTATVDGVWLDKWGERTSGLWGKLGALIAQPCWSLSTTGPRAWAQPAAVKRGAASGADAGGEGRRVQA